MIPIHCTIIIFPHFFSQINLSLILRSQIKIYFITLCPLSKKYWFFCSYNKSFTKSFVFYSLQRLPVITLSSLSIAFTLFASASIYRVSKKSHTASFTVVTLRIVTTWLLTHTWSRDERIVSIQFITIRTWKWWYWTQVTLLKDRQSSLAPSYPIRILFICCVYFTLIMKL